MTSSSQVERVYTSLVSDSRRWEGFKHRPDDILVCTSYKSGTTWMQMICASIVHLSSNLPEPLGILSPWLDMRVDSKGDIFAHLESQPYRRVIKTHTALDGLPWWDDVTYMYVGRDPRDVFMSLQNHIENMNFDRIIEMLTIQGEEVNPPPGLPEDINDRFRLWLSEGTHPWEQDGVPFWSHFHHGETFWEARDKSNVHLMHYADLKSDLGGQMRRVADILDIEVAEDLWDELIEAATFDSMRSNATNRAPEGTKKLWQDNQRFFNKGTSRQWEGVLSDESLTFYREVTRDRYDHDYLDWLEQGSIKTGLKV